MKLKIVVLFQFLWLFSPTLCEGPRFTKLTTGVHLNEIKIQPYESTVPLIFEIPLPDFEEWSKLIPSKFNNPQLLSILNHTVQTTLSSLPVLSAPVLSRVKRALDFVADFSKWCCGFATSNSVDQVLVRQDSIRNFTVELRNQIAFEHQSAIKSTTLFTNHLQKLETALTKLQNDTTQEVRELEEDEEQLESEIIAAALGMYQSTLLQLWTSAIQDCRQSRIPPFLVHPHTLSKDLLHLQAQLFHHGRQLTIPVKQIDLYYKYQISSCIFARDHAVVSVKVPVVSTTAVYTMHQVYPLPFLYNDTVCQLSVMTEFVATEGNRVIPITPHLKEKCNPSESTLCLLPRYDPPVLPSHPCLSAILTDPTVAAISQSCHLTCQKFLRPIVIQLEPKNFAIVAPNTSIEILCPSSEPSTVASPPIGLIQIKIPCFCEVKVGDRRILPDFPCADDQSDVELHDVLPAPFTNLKSSYLNQPVLLKNTQEIINHDWRLEVPHTNFTEPPLPPLDVPQIPTHIAKNAYVTYGNSALIFFFGLFFVFIAYKIFCVPIPFFPGARAMPIECEEDHHAIIGMSLFLTQTFMLLVLLVFVLLIYRRTRRTRRTVRTVPKPKKTPTNYEIPFQPPPNSDPNIIWAPPPQRPDSPTQPRPAAPPLEDTLTYDQLPSPIQWTAPLATSTPFKTPHLSPNF